MEAVAKGNAKAFHIGESFCVCNGEKENFLLKSAEMGGTRFGFEFQCSQKLALVLHVPSAILFPRPLLLMSGCVCLTMWAWFSALSVALVKLICMCGRKVLPA